jgi:hypothetical protein
LQLTGDFRVAGDHRSRRRLNGVFCAGGPGVELAWFIAAFDRAAAVCRESARQHMVEPLPPSLRFNFRAASRAPEPDGCVKFLGGRLLPPAQLLGVGPAQARKYLWVGGKVPQWVNLSVAAADADHTYIEVAVCDRLTDDPAVLYHQREGNPPFHILSPALPPGWESLEASGRFRLGWRATE